MKDDTSQRSNTCVHFLELLSSNNLENSDRGLVRYPWNIIEEYASCNNIGEDQADLYTRSCRISFFIIFFQSILLDITISLDLLAAKLDKMSYLFSYIFLKLADLWIFKPFNSFVNHVKCSFEQTISYLRFSRELLLQFVVCGTYNLC